MFVLTPIAILILAIAGGGISKAADQQADEVAAIETGQTELVEIREETQPFDCESDALEPDCLALAAAGETSKQSD